MTAKKIQKSYFDVLGLCCSSEIPLIEKILKPINGVQEVSVIVASRTVIVLHDNLVISQLQIVNALNQARLEASVRAYGEANYSNKWPSPYAIACGLFLVLSLLKYVYHPLRWFAIVAVIIGILPIILKGYAALRNFTLDTNILVLIAVMGSIALRDYWEAASIVFLFTIAQWLESRASHRATAVMSSLMNMVPQKAVLAETGEEVDASEVIINTILAVKPGENIPIDGIVVDGKCEVDEKTLTGESYPVFKKTDSIVWAGTINLNGYISVKTTALAENCAVAKMAKLVEEAQNNKSKTQRFIDKCAKFYTPAIVAISIGLAAIPAILKVHNQRHWFHLALVVLVSACPCALILSTPVATFCALSKAATIGLLIKGGEYLETLSKIKIMGFDKTGTITRGEFLITEFQCLVDDVTIDKLLYWVSSIESKSSHPMAAALTDYGRSLSIEPKPENVEEFENFPGEGVFGKIDGKYIYVGNRKIASRAGCETVRSLSGYIGEGKSIGYIFLGGVSVGVFSLSDTCRSAAKEAINQLKTMGIKTAMLTGDSNEAAIIAQNQLEGALEVIKAELLPQDKVNIIKEFQKQAPTAMVGDGLNDAPALATADIGISMGVSGSALATDTCHVILMSNDITKIPLAIKLARKTKMKIVQNVIFSILTKVAILALAVAGYPLVWAAVLADVGTCLIVIFNSMLLLKGKEEQAKWSSWKRFFGKKGCGSHSHGNNDCHKHDHSSDVHKHHCSKTCDDHVKDSKPSQTKGCCAPVDHLKQTKHSSVEHKHQCSLTPCGDHEKGINFSKTKGCCESYSGHNRIKSIEKNSNIDGQTNGCSHDHNTGYNCEHIHLCSSVSKSCETEKRIDSVNKHEHCHLKHCTPKSEELSCVHDKVANVCGVTNDCSSSSEKKHVAPCCQSISKKCCDRNIICGENVVKLSEIVVQ